MAATIGNNAERWRMQLMLRSDYHERLAATFLRRANVWLRNEYSAVATGTTSGSFSVELAELYRL
jgi:hypothetical protein